LILSVASGKGGTGKTMVATSLALSLHDQVQLLDCDVEEPNAHIFLKPVFTDTERVCVPVPEVDQENCTHCRVCSEVCAYHAIATMPREVLVFPDLCHGCGACSRLCPEGVITERDEEVGTVESGESGHIRFVQGKLNVGKAMAPPVIRKVKERIDRDGTVIVDVSPGTSCPVVESLKGSDFCLLVTEPSPFGLNDLTLAVELARKLCIPCGLVLNRAGVGDSGVEDYCKREGIPILMTIPLDTEIARSYSKGVPLVEAIPEYRESFLELFDTIARTVRAPAYWTGKR
jgi:MinD superfamily P-loop ATPase